MTIREFINKLAAAESLSGPDAEVRITGLYSSDTTNIEKVEARKSECHCSRCRKAHERNEVVIETDLYAG